MRHTVGRPYPRRITELLHKFLHGILSAAALGYIEPLSKNDIGVQNMSSPSSYRIETLYYAPWEQLFAPIRQ
jgi:hypothetical protein